jgi:hypothetical protein
MWIIADETHSFRRNDSNNIAAPRFYGSYSRVYQSYIHFFTSFNSLLMADVKGNIEESIEEGKLPLRVQ